MRNQFAPICIVGLLVLSGCTMPMSSRTSSTLDPIELPEKPEILDNRTVETFVEATEEGMLYNERLPSHPTENNVSCSAVIGSETENGYLVFVQCTGGIQFENGEHEDVATWSLYHVSDNATKRSSIQDADVRSMESENRSVNPHSGLQIVNFDSPARDIILTLSSNGSESASDVTLSYRIDPNESVIQNNLPFETGTTTRTNVRTSTDVETFTFTFEKPATRLGHAVIIGVLPDGQVVLVRLPPKID